MTVRYFLYFLFLCAFSTGLFANGKVDFVDLQGDIVVFATTEAKQHTPPTCTLVANTDKWAISLNTVTGRASYTLLMTALASGVSVQVESAGDCQDAEGYERPLRIVATGSGSSITSGASADAIPKLAPDLNVLSRRRDVKGNLNLLQNVDTTNSLTNVVNIMGKNVVQQLYLAGVGNGILRIRLTVDGELIWDDSLDIQSGSNTFIRLINEVGLKEAYLFDESFVLEIHAASDTSINVGYSYRPVK